MDIDDIALTSEEIMDIDLTVERNNVFALANKLPSASSLSEFQVATKRLKKQFRISDERMEGNRYRDRFRKRVERMVREASLLGKRTQAQRRAFAVDTMFGELNAYATEITDEIEQLRMGERKFRKARRI